MSVLTKSLRQEQSLSSEFLEQCIAGLRTETRTAETSFFIFGKRRLALCRGPFDRAVLNPHKSITLGVSLTEYFAMVLFMLLDIGQAVPEFFFRKVDQT